MEFAFPLPGRPFSAGVLRIRNLTEALALPLDSEYAILAVYCFDLGRF
jgi:hypothetical protein